jgi:hypothetical protein
MGARYLKRVNAMLERIIGPVVIGRWVHQKIDDFDRPRSKAEKTLNMVRVTLSIVQHVGVLPGKCWVA